MKSPNIFCFVSKTIAVLFVTGDSLHAAPPEERAHWRISVGGAWQSTGDLSFSGGSYSRVGMLPKLIQLAPGQVGDLATAGPLGSVADRKYDDGYVRLSSGTGDPAAIDPLATSNWGYDNVRQVRGDTLSFHLLGTSVGRAQQSVSPSANSWRDQDDSFGPSLQVDYLFPVLPKVRIGPQFAFQFGSVDVGHSGSTFQASQSVTASGQQLTDTYNLRGVIPPAAPYRGTFAGPGPLIDNTPASRVVRETPIPGVQLGQDRYGNDIREVFKSELYTLSFGVTVEADVTERFYVSTAVGFSARILDFETSFREVLDVTHSDGSRERMGTWERDASDVEFLVGGYVQVGLGWQFSPDWGLSAFARYDWLQSFDALVGPSAVHWNSSGVSAGLSVTLSF